MSDTPETDAMALSDSRTDHNWRQLCRKLERERDKWEETARLYCQNSDYHREMREKAERERDEAREKAQQWERIALRVDTERSEVREENAKLRDIAERAIELAVQYYDGPCERDAAKLRAELDELKEGIK
jgi:dsDNA-specific endonuclease/ATPase MutS2